MNTLFLYYVLVLVLYIVHFYTGKSIITRTILSGILSYIVSFGGSTGTDYSVYWSVFDSITFPVYLEDIVWEPGYFYFIVLFKYLGLDYPGVLFILYLIGNYFILKFIDSKQYSIIIILIFLLSQIYGQQYNLHRQMFAVCLGLHSFDLLIKNEYKKYFITILICFFFHASSIVLLLAYVFKRFDGKLMISTLVLVYLFSILIALGILNIDISIMFNYLSDIGSDYVGYEGYEYTDSSSLFIIIYNLLALCVIPLIYKRNEFKYSLFFIIYIIGVTFLNLNALFPLFFRISFYFLSVFICIPSVIINIVKKCPKRSYFPAYILSYLICLYFVVCLFRMIPRESKGLGSVFLELNYFFQ